MLLSNLTQTFVEHLQPRGNRYHLLAMLQTWMNALETEAPAVQTPCVLTKLEHTDVNV